MKIPYGVADFHSLRAEGQLYLDRTEHIRKQEDLGKALLFLRPRRFGKSLWLSVLEAYYDLRTAADHEMLFGDLAIGARPTPLAHRYFVMRWDFSKINPAPSRRGVNARIDSHHERIGNELSGYLNTVLRVFLRDYREHLPEILELREDPFQNFEELLSVIRLTPYRLYLLIDEYDNFANEVLANDRGAYKELVHTAGPFKYLFKLVKGLMAGAGLERLFITGVSPMVMSDVTSGMNIARDVFLKPALAGLCGFTEQEVDALVDTVLREQDGEGEIKTELSAAEIKLMVREWYNGYRFALKNQERVYNPTLVFYFILNLLEEGGPPRQMLDSNLAADEKKLDELARLAIGRDEGNAGRGPFIDLIRKDEPLKILQIRNGFTLKELLENASQDSSFLGSYLFYLGMLTLGEEETALQETSQEKHQTTLKLIVPNEVMHSLYVARLRKILMPLGASRSDADICLFAFLESGDLEPLLDFIERALFPDFSNRDAAWANELTVKTIFLTLLWNDASYITFSEPELEHLYADLCLLRRPDARASSLWDLLFEFKRLPLKKLGMSGKELRAASRAELMGKKEVKAALDQAETQLSAYGAALERRQGEDLKLRSYAVVALGFERLVVRVL